MNSKLNYRIIGDGYPVVFLHGFLESQTMWKQLRFPTFFTCIFIDLPGHGKSNINENQFETISDVAVLVSDLLVELKINQFSIVGHSMGGYVGLEVLQKSVDCEHLVLLNSNFWTDTPIKIRDRKRVANIVLENKNHFLYEAIPNLFKDPQMFDEEVKQLLNEALQIESETIAKCSIAMSKRNDFSQFLERNESKVSMIQGKDDAIIPQQLFMRKIKHLNDVKVAYASSGHMAHFEDSKFITEVITGFIKNRNY